ncbi:cilia- and flagella-associated protein 54 isoform X7 [Desmodus rotundus]|uniref:cilia- and flagella-associated protein 54 isoform X7 n=1 Tax=Desmodus rotundus TaxID=9430 RepID=UPI0023810790|nr:cilia- and flagella-associated protein 54 isoform X7 [Desmodus rotundus]
MAAQGHSPTYPSSNTSASSVSPSGPTPLPPSTTASKSPLESKASSLNPLPRSTCCKDSLPLAVFYGPLDAKNPLLASCEKEIQELLGFMKRKKALATAVEQKHEFHRRCATSLFNIWTKYAPRLPAAYYNEKLLKVGDSLCDMKEYKLALLQCYGRYLQQFSINFDENKADVHQFKTVFFPKGFGDKNATHTFHALSGKNICKYQLVCDSDTNLQNKESVIQCLDILSSLRLIMQVALPQEHLCWIIFNGTIYIYTICRKLMIIGQSSKALEYLLWASMCMESSVPLLSVRYLTWRATLYTAVCQCCYDCQASIHGESFARRALAKIDELRQLELMGSSKSSEESRRDYREATIKMAVMIFKRGVFESRRKNKNFFRPKIRVNLREVQTLPWPRTVTERLLDEMFDSTAARFLAVLEALSDSNRRTLQVGPIVTDEVEVRDVVSELFLAGRELLIMASTGVDGMLGFPKTSLLELTIKRKNVISMDAAVKFIKLAFTYEEWSLFESAAGQLIDFLQGQDDPESKKAEKDLTLLIAMEPVINVKRNKGLILPLENYKEGQSAFYVRKIAFHDTCMKTYGCSEDIFHLATTLYSCVCISPQEAYSLIEKSEVEQNALYSYQKNVESSKRKKSRIPPPPILLSRTYCSVTLKPAPFISDVKVSWYCILGCRAEGSYGKVRLNNNHLPSSGEAIPADGKSIFEVKGLETNEKYVFAIAAYSSHGKLVGDAVGEATKPILVYPPLSAVTSRMFLTQVAYQIGDYELAKKVFSPVWDYFVASPPQNEQSVICLSNIMTITQRRLHSDILAETSSILLYLFLRNIFVTSDIKIKEENLFCDNIKGNEIFPSQQIARLIECERVLVALELSNYLNDSSYALQAVTQCYGLLAPIIYHNIVLVPVVQILIKCIVVLQGLPNIIHSKKHVANFGSVQHMIACCIFYITKILRSWKEYDLAVIIINYGKKMLDITPECKSPFGAIDQEDMQEEGSSKKSAKTKKPQQILSPEKINEQLVLLETHLLKLTKQYITAELSGTEDPIFLYPIVLNWSVKGAVKEVMKFKQRPRFLEFFTQIMLKCMSDEKFHLVLEITNPVCDFLRRRNESLLGAKKMKYKDNMLSKRAAKPGKNHKAAVMEIGRTSDIQRRRSKKKDTLREFLSKNPGFYEMTEHERNKRTDVRKIAHRILLDCLNPLIFNYVKKRRFHQICLEEMPWKALMNLCLANAHFNLFLIKQGERTKMKCGTPQKMVSFRSCDPSVFSLYNSGTVLPTGKLTLENYKVMLEFLHTAKQRKANLPSDAEDFLTLINPKMSDENVSKTQTVSDSDPQSGLSGKEKDRLPNSGLLDHFTKIFLYCRRAMVLAHRGGFWTLLQNCCRALWNFTQELQILLRHAVDMSRMFPVSQDGFICISVLPFYLGAELLIDMLIELQNTNSIEIIEEKGEFSVPSCYGNIKNDNGGSSLTFEHPLDDVNVVDLKWIHDFVLKALELLYQVEKWETLVSLAIQFNTISHERYTEQVTPLLVYAQRQLLLRISKFEGPDITQQPCVRHEAEHKEKITCRNFIGKQLKINPPTNKVTETGNSLDSLRKLVLSEYSQAKELVCVPVDVTDTLRCFRETLEKSKYHNRAIRHSRKLLSLFLAQTQGVKVGINISKLTPGKVEFCPGTEEMHMPAPPDLSQEHFRVFSSVEKSKLPYSQLGLVISSFYKTVDILQASNQRSLKVQALHQLGSLLVFAGKKRAAFKCWCQALDDVFRKEDALHTWKEFGTSLTSATDSSSPPGYKDYSEEFLSRVGIWGCLQGAVISAKIAQFIKELDVEKRSNCCLLSALLFQGLLRTTLPHPKAERCYAQYEITQLLPGIELFSDVHRADICSVVASLYYVIRELHFAKQNIVILPLLALYQYFVSGICQDLVRNLEARILKIEVLTDLRFFSEAFHEMSQIFYGKNMPSLIPAGVKTSVKVKVFQSFDSGKPLTSKENIQALDELMHKGLPQILVTIGHQHLLNKFSFVKAYLLVSVAATINCVPENLLRTVYHGFVSERSRANLPNLKDLCLKDDRSSFNHLSHLRKAKDEFTLNAIKSILLTEAEEKLNTLVSELGQPGHKNLSECSAGPLEVVVQARLQLAEIALQRHRAAYSAAIVFSTLKLLQDSKLFKKKVVQDDRENSLSPGATENKDDDEFLDPISLNSREYFNIHLWLRCRLALVTAFVAQIRGIGIMKENDMTDYVSLINEACAEAKSAGDKELEAEFLMQAVIIGLQEKHLKADIITNLQAIIHLLEGSEFISPRSRLTLVRSLLLLDDLTKAERFKRAPSSKTEKINLLTQSHNILIDQMLTFGETIEFPSSNTDYASPLQPLKNVYLPHVMLLARTKMRIGHTMAKQVHYNSKKKDSSKWLPALQLFEIALKLCKISATDEHEVEAEILFQKGKIERQILMEEKSPNSPLESLCEAIQLSLNHDQNSGLIRDSYLEIALLYLNLRNAESKLSTAPSTSKAPIRRHSSVKEATVSRYETCTSLAWIAIRAAAQVSRAVLAINLLIGKTDARTDEVSQAALPHIPEFATVDLLSSYTDYLLDNYQVAFQTSYTFFYESDDICETTDASKKTPTKVDITWILLLRYYIHLQRINNMSKLLASPKSGPGISLPDDTLLTSLFNSGLILRQKEMHNFLKKFLQLYSSSCIDEFPTELFQELENLPFSENVSYDSLAKMPQDGSLHSILPLKLLAASSAPSAELQASDTATQALNKELCFLWYIPPLERPPKELEPMVLLLYAHNLKSLKVPDENSSNHSSGCVGSFWVPLNSVISIHEKLSNLTQIAEILLPATPEVTADENIPEIQEMQEKPIDSEMKNMIIECCFEIRSLFLTEGETPSLSEVPFHVSLQSIFNLERLFDLANGCIISGGSLFNWIVSIIP